ncbi:hypothetical protein [Aeoliella sp.]|uniref:hypothetical protein n=1 Tax=Aeoliella sp. TaxID=2795800 RepID=UPI003CCBB2B1
MKRVSIGTVVLALMPLQVAAQAPTQEKREIVVAHRIKDWHTEHFEDSTKAQQHVDALKKLGAEVRVEQHSGHTDVTYRTVGWKPLRVETDDLAHQWQEWLQRSGFETVHGHSPDHDEHAHHEGHDHGDEHDEVVLYRSSRRQSQHFDSVAAANEFVTLAQALGCRVEKSAHAGHTDVSFICPEWTAVELSDHKAAEAWMKWLQTAGFEVQHDDEHEKGHKH